MRAILLDPRTGGISGDMLCAALADLTGSIEPLEALAGAIASLPRCSAFRITLEQVERPVRAAFLNITLEEEPCGSDAGLVQEMDTVIRETGLAPAAAAKAHSILDDLVQARDRLHPKAAGCHVLASSDTIFDILGPLALLEDAGLFGCPVYTTPPALGGGMICTPGGVTGGPAPAALEILARHRIPVAESSLAMELTTPTGAALLANLAGAVTRFPAMTPLRTGYGAGSIANGAGANILRVVEGGTDDLTEERIVMLETNLDDADGEVIGYAREKLFAAGAVDVFVTPASGKKNRPVQILSVITTRERYPELVRILMDETGTLGVRIREEPRLVADRTPKTVRVTVRGKPFTVRVKTSRTSGRVIAVKPEYEDMKEIAQQLGIPLREVMREVYRQLPADR